MGDVVNTASRLQQVAPPGAVLVGDATRDAVLAEPALPARRGGPAPRPRSGGAGVAGGRARLGAARQALAVRRAVRRPQRPSSTCSATWHRSRSAGRSAIVAVTGEPGIGKSRLVARGRDDDHADRARHVPARGRVRPVRRVERVVAGGRWLAGHGSDSTATRRRTSLGERVDRAGSSRSRSSHRARPSSTTSSRS